MRIELNAAGVEDALDHMRDLLTECAEQYRELHSHFLKDRDGYPSSSMNGGPPTSEYDDETDENGKPVLDENGNLKKIPLPPRSDPVARIVIGRDEGEGSTGQSLASFVNKIQVARRTLEAAVGEAKTALQPPKKITPEDEIWCENCLRAEVHSPRAEGRKVCTWCRDEQSERGVLPSPRLVEAHTRYGRVTEKLRVQIRLREAEERRARKKKRKDVA